MLRHIVCQSRDAKTDFIKHYDNLLQMYSCEEDIIRDAIDNMKSDIIKKANEGKSRYITYLKINPNLKRPHIYNNFIPTNKLHKMTRIRTVSHTLEIELGRHGRNRVDIANRLCHCEEVETEEHFLLNCTYYTHIRQKYGILDSDNVETVLERTNITNYVWDLHNTRALYK